MSSPIFSSDTSQQRWADKLNHHFIVYVENPPSIFQVPSNIADTNPECYAPQDIGIGPYHHFRRDLDDMESTKLAAIKTFLNPEQLHSFKSLVVDVVRALEPSIRSCYDKYLDLDSDTLAWAMAIDGVYLLHLFSKNKQPSVSPNARKLAQDVLMMENQFPCTVLNQIRKALFQPPKVPSSDQHIEEEEEEGENRDISMAREELFSEMLCFCRSHSPLDIEWQISQIDKMINLSPSDIVWDAPRNSPHILDLLYRLLVLKLSREEPVTYGAMFALPPLADFGAELIGLKEPLELVENLPYQECFNLFRNNANSSKNSAIEQIRIPSASQLHQAAKVQFRSDGQAVEYYEKGKRILFLPKIRLTTDSEVILRNLVAYELALGSNDNVVSGFVDLMCGLIDTSKDVELLKESGIILTDLPCGEVAKMFNGINKSSGMVDRLEQITQKMNAAYDSIFRIRCSRFVKNHLIPSENSVKLVLWILLVSLLVLQAFCQIYGCSDHWFASK